MGEEFVVIQFTLDKEKCELRWEVALDFFVGDEKPRGFSGDEDPDGRTVGEDSACPDFPRLRIVEAVREAGLVLCPFDRSPRPGVNEVVVDEDHLTHPGREGKIELGHG